MMVLALGLAVLEFGLRGYLAVAGRPYDATRTRAELQAAIDTVERPFPQLEREGEQGLANIKDAYVLHPYYGFTAKEDLEEVALLTEEFAAGIDPDTYVVVVLGGSVAGMLGVPLRELLGDHPSLQGKPVRVINLARGANRQPQQLVRTFFMLGLGLEPDAIVNVDGFNEAAFGRNNFKLGVHPSYPYWPRWGHLTLQAGSEEGLRFAARVLAAEERAVEQARGALGGPWLSSAIAGRLLLARSNALAHEWVARQGEYELFLAGFEENATARGPRFPGGAEDAMDSVLRTWSECSVALAGYCRARGIDYVHVLQPTLYDAGSKPLTEVELERGRHARSYREGVLEGYPRMRDSAAGLAAAGVRFRDASMLFEAVEEEIYTDYCHLNGLGNDLLGEVVVEELLALRALSPGSPLPAPESDR